MAKSEIIRLDVKNLDVFKSFVELISNNIDCVSEPLKSRLVELSEDRDIGWINWSSLRGFIDNDNCTVMLNGEDVCNVTSYNKMLRKVVVVNEVKNGVGCGLKEVSANSFSVSNNGESPYVEW